MSGLAGIGRVRQALAAVVIFSVASALGTVAGAANEMMKGSSGGNGGGMGFKPGLMLNLGQPPLIVVPSQPTHCDATEVYSQQFHKCVRQTKDTGACGAGDVYSQQFHKCVPLSRDTGACQVGQVYSQQFRKCVSLTKDVTTCTYPDVYSPEYHHCVPSVRTVNCTYPMVKQGSSCTCAYGYTYNGDTCTRPTLVITPPPVIVKSPPPVIVNNPPPVIVTTPPVTYDKPPVVQIDVTHIQQCLQKLGYDPGSVDGSAGDATRAAFRSYQMANGLAGRPFYLGDQPTQFKLYQMCNAPTQQVSLQPASNPPPPPPLKVAPVRCLAPDLYDMLKSTYGKAPAIQPCTPQTAACVPRPLTFDDAKLQSVAASAGVTFCNSSCIRLGSYLPLSSIEAIEAAAGITLCAAPPALCYVPGRPVVERQVEIRTIYKDKPVGAGNEGNIAVVIGDETYQNDITPHVYGHADADAMVQLLTEQLGYRKDNIIDLRDAGLADFQRIFGTADNPVGELATRIKAEGQNPGDVIVYISSHGLASQDGSAAYLLPVDGKTDALDQSGYPLKQLYANLGKAGARTIMLMLEATFGTSITDTVNAPNIPELEVANMPETAIAGLAVFTAADRDQHALEDPEYGIGLFTRYMIAGLAGDADAAPIGNGDKRIDTVELYVYTADKVRTAARKSFGEEQKPILSKIDNLLVGSLASN